MCGGGVEDNSDKVAQIEADRSRTEREAAEKERLRKEGQFTTDLNSSYGSAIEDARRYFQEQGLDPTQFDGAITRGANSKKSAVPFLDAAPGSYFSGLGQSVFDSETESKRNKATKDINSFSRDGFSRDTIKDTSDDAFIDSILEEQYLDSQRRIEGQKARGTLNDFGLTQALKDLDRQKSGARTNLDALGGGVLEQGRGKLNNIASSGRTAAQQIALGDEFDPFKYQRDINDEAASFFAGLGDKIKGIAPQDLFDLSSAFQIGGRKQGVTNGGFDASASSGVFDLFDEEDKKKKDKEVSLF